MNKFDELEQQNLKHVVKESGVYIKNKNGELCEFCVEYFVDKSLSDKEFDNYHKQYEKVINKVTDEMIMNDENNEIVDLRFLNNMSDKVTFE